MFQLGKAYNLAVLILISGLSACGSGGGGGSATSPPSTPANILATGKDGYVLISGTLPGNATGANIYWSAASGVSANSTRFSVTGLPQAVPGLVNNTTYFFRVSAVNSGGESALSGEVSAATQAITGAVDPLFVDQWHLKNTGQAGGTSNEDVNVNPAAPASGVTAAWTLTKGAGVKVAVVDDGLELSHEDLASNIDGGNLSYNYVTGTHDPTNPASDISSGHGTAVAGIVAARDNNGLGGAGVAPRASLVGYNLLQASISSNEFDAMTRNAAAISVSSNSWGAPDNTGELDASTALWRQAIDTGTSTGRNNKGIVYLWAAGNGGTVRTSCDFGCDDSNYDGRANYRGVMAVAAVNDRGQKSTYSEYGANLWVSAPGGEYCYPNSITTNVHTITTTDRTGETGFNRSTISFTAYDYPASGNTVNRNYTRCMNGTSAATPAVAGTVALMLAVNPNLGWRDVRWILAKTARKNDATDTGWVTNGANFHFNHKYGFGVVDASAAATAAQTWSNVGPELTYTSALSNPNIAIPDNNTTGVSNTITVANSGISFIEFIEVTFTATNSPYPGDLAVILTKKPNGTKSVLARPHVCPNGSGGSCKSTFSNWVFGDAAHYGESADGDWELNVSDWYAQDTGNFVSWKIKFYGH